MHQFNVRKVWDDDKDKEKLRPDSVTLQIYKNGEAYGDKFSLTEADNWRKAISLPVYDAGNAIEWTIKELEIPRYYAVTYDQSTMTVTNTIQSALIPKTGDFNNLWMWIVLFGGCSVGAVSVLLFERKKRAVSK